MNETLYDYERQAWVVNGCYERCGHPDSMACDCYGRKHAGERTDTNTMVRMRAQAQEPPVN